MTDGERWRPDALAICVPIRNERVLLPRLIAALAAQDWRDVPPVTLCLLFDGCTDGSADVLATGAPFPMVADHVPAGPPNAGRARQLAMALGQGAVARHPAAALLTTDADSEPAGDWIAATCRALGQADVAAGRIARRPSPADAAQDRVEAYYDRLHRLRREIDPVPWEAMPTHHQTGGASLAFRADVYATLGGFAARPSGEDAAIIDEAQRAGFRVRRDAGVRVTTSSRRHGRAEGGLATHLARLDAGSAPARVAHPFAAAWQYNGHAAARAAWANVEQPSVSVRLADRLALDPAHIRRVAASCVNAESFATRLVPAGPGGERLVTLDEAERALDLLERQCSERAA